MSGLEEIQRGNMKSEGGKDGCVKKRRIRAENWSERETLQMLELRKVMVESSSAKGSDAWEQIAQQLRNMNPESEARSPKQVAQRWDTLVKVYVSIEDECCESGRAYGEVLDERQKRCKTEYRQLWHELIAQGNPGKRRPGKAPVQAGEAPHAPAASLSPGASGEVMTHVLKFGEIAKPLTEMLDTIDASISTSKVGNNVLGQVNEAIATGCNWEPEDHRGLETMISVNELKKRQEETELANVVRATQSMTDTMRRISEAASTSESFFLEVDKKEWSMLTQRLSAFSRKVQENSVKGIREEVGEAVRIPNIQIISTQRTSSPATSTDTFAGLSDVEPLSPGFSNVFRGGCCESRKVMRRVAYSPARPDMDGIGFLADFPTPQMRNAATEGRTPPSNPTLKFIGHVLDKAKSLSYRCVRGVCGVLVLPCGTGEKLYTGDSCVRRGGHSTETSAVYISNGKPFRTKTLLRRTSKM